jgi:phosphatidylglycerol---prolipoprotein diacylglyceryl transferase
MHPILIDLGVRNLPLLGETHLFLPTYGLLFTLGAMAAWWWFARRAGTLGVPAERAFDLGFWGLVAGLVGAKLALLVVEWRYYLQYPGEILGALRSAGVLLGGVIAGAVAFWAYCRRHGLPVWKLADAVVAPLALAQAIGRLGCHSAGCCYGVAAGACPIHVTFTHPFAHDYTGVPLYVPLIPTQLLQAGNDLILAGILTWMWRRSAGAGTLNGSVFWWYVILYGTTRSIIEIWRGDVVRGLWLGGLLSTSQILSILGIVLAVVMLLRAKRAAVA